MQRYMLIVVATPALLAILASLWPLERHAVAVVCAVLAIATLATLICARSLRQLFVGVATIAFLLSVALTDWPLRAAYRLSRPSFDRVAAQVRAGHPPEAPFSIGLFRIRKVSIRQGVVCLWTDDDPSGATGFVQHGAEDLPFNLWSHEPLDGSWQFISED